MKQILLLNILLIIFHGVSAQENNLKIKEGIILIEMLTPENFEQRIYNAFEHVKENQIIADCTVAAEPSTRDSAGTEELLNNLFKHPYTKMGFIVNDLGISRLTAANYLNKLADDKMLRKNKLGTGDYYINEELIDLLTKR